MKLNRYAFIKEALNLPQFDFRIEQDDAGKLSIFDPLRKKFLILTPEEWVRQRMICYLVEYKQYPKNLFSLEKGIHYNTLQKRFDVLILDRTGNPFLLIECKSPYIVLSQKTVEQVAVYNKIVGAPYIGLSNGKQHIFLSFDNSKKKYQQITEIPLYQSKL